MTWRAATWWTIACGGMVAIYVLSDRPITVPRPLRFPHADKVAHLLEYATLAGAWLGALRATWPAAARGRHAALAALLAAAYGATDEWHQSFVPGRSAEVADWCADAAGALFILVAACGRIRAKDRPTTPDRS